MQRQVVLPQLCGIHQHLVLLDESAQPIHVDHAGDALEQRPQDPVLKRPLLHQFGLHDRCIGILRVRSFQVVLIDFAEPGTDRGHHGINPPGQPLFRRHHALEHELAREVDIDVVLEHDSDL